MELKTTALGRGSDGLNQMAAAGTLGVEAVAWEPPLAAERQETMRRWATVLLLLLLPATAQDGGGLDGPSGPPPKKDPPPEKEKEKDKPPELPFDEEGCGEDEAAEEAPEGPDHAQAEFDKAVALQRKGKWTSARRAFRKFLKNHPDHPLVPMARERGGDNAFLGVETLRESGPPARRIDVSVMGDGFTLDDQTMEERWAKLCLDVLFNEKVFEEYKDYFNFYFVRLASFEEGVDPGLSPEELKKAQERNLRRRRDINYKLDYSTALDCKALGPQGQVMADSSLVYKWLDVAAREVPGCADDKFVIAYARFGILGMGGGGIANVGRPDKSVTVHEFGHAFSRLLDEYAINPEAPQGMFGRALIAANAYPSPEEPKPEDVPWAHMLKKRVKGVGIYEGGATFKKGVWRPARSCAMNTGGNQFCPVCREQTLLVIYEYVSPIDETTPDPAKDLEVELGGPDELVVIPMQPEKHRLKAAWYVDLMAVTTDGAQATPETPWPMEEEAAPPDPLAYPTQGFANPYMGRRVQGSRDDYDEPPKGKASRLGDRARKRKDGRWEYAFPLGKLPAGGYVITAEVWDDTDLVVQDEKHLLKERVSWRVRIAPPAAAPNSPKR